MRGQKYCFDFKFGISVKFRVDWCIRLYDSYRICLRFPANSSLRRREYVRNIGNIGKSNMNHIVLYINRRDFYADFESEVKKIFLPTHFRENHVLKNLRGRIQKFWIFLNPSWNSDSKYTHISSDRISQALEPKMF